MKTKVLIFTIILSLGMVFQGCEKEENFSQKPTTSKVSNNTKNKSSFKTLKLNDFPIKIKKGRNQYPDDNGTCGLSLPCGPCAGICIRWEKPSIVPFGYVLSNSEVAKGYTIIKISGEGLDENKLILKLNEINGIISDSNDLIISENSSIGEDVSHELGYTDVIFLKGTYLFNSNDSTVSISVALEN